MYYRIIDEEGIPRATGYNATDLQELRNDLADLIEPQLDAEEEGLEGASLSTLLFMERCSLEENETPFENDPIDEYFEEDEGFFL